jgi:hypothetical protein
MLMPMQQPYVINLSFHFPSLINDTNHTIAKE